MELLKKLCGAYSPSGNEKTITDLIFEEIKDYADSVYKDVLGNLVAVKKSDASYENPKKIMLAAHCDEIGAVVTFIDDNGFLRFSPVGGVNAIFSLYQRVEFKNGLTGIVSYEEDIDGVKNVTFSKMFIDIGAKNKEEAEKMVKVGDFASFKGEFSANGTRIFSKALDNRAGVYVLIKTLKSIKTTQNELYFVFTSQEEVGLRGARVSAFDIMPDIAIAVDVTDTGDTPNCKRSVVKLSGGAAIKVKDSSVICDSDVRLSLEKCAEENNIPFQREVLAFGGTDAGAIHLTKSGVKTGGVSIPVRYIHSTCECADFEDINACVNLLANYLK